MASQFCPKCGKSNFSGSPFCANCGNSLTAFPTAQQQQPAAVPSYSTPQAPSGSPYHDYTAAYYETERFRGIDRTKTGLLLLVIGFLVSWVPFVGLIGGLLEVIGAIMVILGRHTFGREHARNVLWAIIIFVVGIVASVVAVFVIVFSAIAANLRSFNRATNPSTPPNFFFNTAGFYAALVVGIAIVDISYVLLTYALQKRNGRIILWCGYVAGISAIVINFFLLNGNIFLTALPSLVPAVLYGYAYYLARDRIERGEIPVPPVQPSPVMPAYVSPGP